MKMKDVLGYIADLQSECSNVLEQETHPFFCLDKHRSTVQGSYTSRVAVLWRETIDALDTLASKFIEDVYSLEKGDTIASNSDLTEDDMKLCVEMNLDPRDADTTLAVRKRAIFLTAKEKIFPFSAWYVDEAIKIQTEFGFHCAFIRALFKKNSSTKN